LGQPDGCQTSLGTYPDLVGAVPIKSELFQI
jgi:hypothetical protein